MICAIFIFKKKSAIYIFLKKNEIKTCMIDYKQLNVKTIIVFIILIKNEKINENVK